jgi:hypothetical protein
MVMKNEWEGIIVSRETRKSYLMEVEIWWDE